jgi:putative membrane protein
MMGTNEEPHGRFEVRVTSDSHFGWIRTRLAIERTLMSWMRTSVSLIGFGFTIVQFFQRLNGTEGVVPALRPEAPRQLGLALIGCGVLGLLISLAQYRRIVKYLWSEQFKVLAGMESKDMAPIIAQSPVMAIVIAMIFIGVFAFGAVLMRLV